MQKIRKDQGITLIVLVITIIILLILAGITIGAITGTNGMIENAENAKEETEIANEKEIVNNATVQAMENNKYGNIEQDELQEQLNKITDIDETDVQIIRRKLIVEFTNSNRMYRVDDNGNVYEYVYAELPMMENGGNFNNRMAEYRANILTVTVLDNIDIPKNTYQVFDVSEEQNETVKAWLVENEENAGMYDLYIGGSDGVDIRTCQNMFNSFSNCIKINLENLYTEKVKDFSFMFLNNTHLKEIHLENLNTSNATNMNSMFNNCTSLTELNISNFDTSNVTNMGGMFYRCALTKIDLSNFNTSKVTSMNAMFRECYSITELDLSSFDTSNLTRTDNMFFSAYNLKTIYVSDKWVNDKITLSDWMFRNCSSLSGAINYDSTKLDIAYANYENGYFTYKQEN